MIKVLTWDDFTFDDTQPRCDASYYTGMVKHHGLDYPPIVEIPEWIYMVHAVRSLMRSLGYVTVSNVYPHRIFAIPQGQTL